MCGVWDCEFDVEGVLDARRARSLLVRAARALKRREMSFAVAREEADCFLGRASGAMIAAGLSQKRLIRASVDGQKKIVCAQWWYCSLKCYRSR